MPRHGPNPSTTKIAEAWQKQLLASALARFALTPIPYAPPIGVLGGSQVLL